MPEINVRTYTNNYKEDVANLVVTIQRSEFFIPITLDDQPDLKEIDKVYQIKKGNFWIATHDGKLVGTIALIDVGNSQGALRKMFVDAKYRGKEMGVAKKLLDTLLQWAHHHQFAELFLGTTEKFIGAQKFYEKNGFKEIGKAFLPTTFPIMEVDVKFYKFSLPKDK
jgi:N-acetylglutamate synthase-like GNAT family acetyltransferase